MVLFFSTCFISPYYKEKKLSSREVKKIVLVYIINRCGMEAHFFFSLGIFIFLVFMMKNQSRGKKLGET